MAVTTTKAHRADDMLTDAVALDDTAHEPSPHRRRDIEGIRTIAIVAVVLYHSRLGAAAGGYVGGDGFFRVSGFLITGLLWRELAADGRVSLRKFYARRARRLLPAAVLVIIATMCASKAVLPPLQTMEVGKDGVASAAYVANYRFAATDTSYLQAATTPSPLQHFWSLGVEEQFYLMWPALVIAASLPSRRRLRIPSRRIAALMLSMVGVASFLACVRLTRTSRSVAFFSLPTRAWEFVIGGLVALLAPRVLRISEGTSFALGWLGLGLIAYSVLSFDAATRFPGTAAFVPVAGAACLIVAGL